MRWFAWLVLAGCVPDHSTVAVHVTDSAGQPLEGATVAAACDARSHSGGAGRTLADGSVVVTLFSADGPCVVTVSLPRFDPVQLRDVPACDPDATCPPIEVALVQVLP